MCKTERGCGRHCDAPQRYPLRRKIVPPPLGWPSASSLLWRLNQLKKTASPTVMLPSRSGPLRTTDRHRGGWAESLVPVQFNSVGPAPLQNSFGDLQRPLWPHSIAAAFLSAESCVPSDWVPSTLPNKCLDRTPSPHLHTISDRETPPPQEGQPIGG